MLQPGDVQEPLAEINLILGQGAKLADPQAVAKGDQDHRGVAMAVTAPLARRGNQPLDLDRCQVLARAPLTIALPSRWRDCLADNPQRRRLSRDPDCPVLSAWHGLVLSLDRRQKPRPDWCGCLVSDQRWDTSLAGTNKIILKQRL